MYLPLPWFAPTSSVFLDECIIYWATVAEIFRAAPSSMFTNLDTSIFFGCIRLHKDKVVKEKQIHSEMNLREGLNRP